METDDFEWEDEKAELVLRKRGISFWTAAAALDDLSCIALDEDTRHEYRMKTVGMVDGQLYTVISADGLGAPTRIITVWYATKAEQNAYWQANETHD